MRKWDSGDAGAFDQHSRVAVPRSLWLVDGIQRRTGVDIKFRRWLLGVEDVESCKVVSSASELSRPCSFKFGL